METEKPSLAAALARCPLVAILRGVAPNEVAEVATVLVDAGFAVVEVPLNSPDPLRSISTLNERFGEAVLVGAGTVIATDDVSRVAGAGGRLVVSPNTDPLVIEETKRLGMVSIPGACTPTEAFRALAAGADALKLFPAEALSPAAVKALASVLPGQIPLLAVGGIGAANMAEYLRAGAAGFGIGSSLYKPGKPLAQIARDAKSIVDAYASCPVDSRYGE